MTGADFRIARLALGLSQTELGAALGLSLRQVRNLEHGVTAVRPAYALAVRGMLAVKHGRSSPPAPVSGQ